MRKRVFFLILVAILGSMAVGYARDLVSAYTLNVVYFLPSGMQPVEGYRQRLSDILLYTQDFYQKEMLRNGFGDKTLGLRKETDGKVRILLIKGKRNADYYPYDGGGGRVIQEVDAWLNAHPTERGSGHTLVFMPTITGDENPGGVPFYGMGKICFALDYKYFDLKYLGDPLLTKWLGGMAHELGHGLNLPHNSQKVSEQKTLGTALMGAGNYTFGMKPTFLTKASCGILNNCEVFATAKGDFYKEAAEVEVRNMHIEFKEETISIRAGYRLSLPCNGINIYYDNAPYGSVNTDYDAESFFLHPNHPDSLVFRIPKRELFDFAKNDFQIRIVFLFTNGNSYQLAYAFHKDSVTDYHFVKREELDKTGWSVMASDEQRGTLAAQVLDGASSTFWHSAWYPVKKDFPHKIIVILDKAQKIHGISVLQRPGLHGAVKEFRLYGKENEGWKDLGLYVLQQQSSVQYIDLPQPMVLESFILECLSNYNPEDPKIAALAEIGAY